MTLLFNSAPPLGAVCSVLGLNSSAGFDVLLMLACFDGRQGARNNALGVQDTQCQDMLAGTLGRADRDPRQRGGGGLNQTCCGHIRHSALANAACTRTDSPTATQHVHLAGYQRWDLQVDGYWCEALIFRDTSLIVGASMR